MTDARMLRTELYKLYLWAKHRHGTTGNQTMVRVYHEAWQNAALYAAYLEKDYPYLQTWEEFFAHYSSTAPGWPLYDNAPYARNLRRGRMVAESDHLAVWLSKGEDAFLATGLNTGVMGPYESVRDAYLASDLEDEYYHRREFLAA